MLIGLNASILLFVFFPRIETSDDVFVWEIARFLGVFGINTASDISKFTTISLAAASFVMGNFEVS